jgi:hypothetical protein
VALNFFGLIFLYNVKKLLKHSQEWWYLPIIPALATETGESWVQGCVARAHLKKQNQKIIEAQGRLDLNSIIYWYLLYIKLKWNKWLINHLKITINHLHANINGILFTKTLFQNRKCLITVALSYGFANFLNSWLLWRQLVLPICFWILCDKYHIDSEKVRRWSEWKR